MAAWARNHNCRGRIGTRARDPCENDGAVNETGRHLSNVSVDGCDECWQEVPGGCC